ncbi:serine hydrolase domain-containing protein [Streptomyces netropsis]|uniref:D-alanyl-D-alanine carboxypeptidase n=1 Tax=Streptomyces netropsis TaxID=55404 RepID=A0A7W7PEK4_STRNE|nr:serine hydrolase domain-containing protein [Streptomyces netropsis]MBB4887931.1 D-alanyl-D-alanine carboxypeptidase [Streptomyces netropsis]GGR33252.1 D-alanyl-D-alanine carboxypeptidase [Streptomyces netropsis]
MVMLTVRTRLAAVVVAATMAAAIGLTAPAKADGAPAAPATGHGLTQAALDSAVKGGVPGAFGQAHDTHGTWYGSSGVSDLTTRRPPLPPDRFRAGSISKTLIATVVLQLEAEGRLSIDDTVEKWLPGVVRGHGHDGSKITLRRLLNHTSGVYDYTEDPGLHLLGTDFLAHRYDTWTPEQLVALAMKHRPNFEPGAGWSYSTTAFTLAAMVIERATGHTYASEAKRRIFTPLGLHASTLPGTYPRIPAPSGRMYTVFSNDPEHRVHDITEFNPSWAWSAGELISSTSDLNRFFTALLGGKLLPRAQLKEMTTTVPSPNFPWGQEAGLGIFRLTLPCGTELWGHTGFLPGSQSIAYTTRDGQHGLVYNFNTDWAGETDAAAYVFLAEYCGTTPPLTTHP